MNTTQIIIKISHKHAVIRLAIREVKWMGLFMFLTLNSMITINQIIHKTMKSSCRRWVIRIKKDILLIMSTFLFIIIIIIIVVV